MRVSVFLFVAAGLLTMKLIGENGAGDIFQAPAALEPYEGASVVLDGDTLRVDGTKIRLMWVDACEMGQPTTAGNTKFDCGQWAKDKLIQIINGQRVRCSPQGAGYYQRILATCETASGVDLSSALLSTGTAFLYGANKAPVIYLDAERAARQRAGGVHGFSDLVHPKEFRQLTKGRS